MNIKNYNIEQYLLLHLSKTFQLSLKDSLILSYIYTIYKNDKSKFISKQKILKDLPILEVKGVRALGKRFKTLINKNIITDIITDKEAFEILIANKNNSKFESLFDLQCEWCLNFVPRLDKHHYPVRRKHKGIDIVNICSYCHNGFHSLTDMKSFIKINIDFFNNIKL